MTYVDAWMAVDFNGYDFTYVELDHDLVLIAFRDGQEVHRTYDVAGSNDWIKDLAASDHIREKAMS